MSDYLKTIMIYKKKSYFLEWKEEIMTSLIVLACLILLTIFPSNGALQFFTKSLFFLLIVPILYIKLVLKKNLSQFGFNFKNYKIGFLWSFAAFGFSLLLFFMLLRFYPSPDTRSLPNAVVTNFWAFLFYELIIINSLFFLQQFFVQGFVLFFLKEKFGAWSVIISFLILLIFLLIGGSPSLADLPLLVFFLTANFASYKSSSFIYSYVAGLLFFVSTHAYLIHLIK
jgi:hypothetical protein